MQYMTASADETIKIAKQLGEVLPADSLIILNGDLGMGKTVFAKGLAAGLGITERITSPTFLLVQEYEGGRLPFCHMDAYRLEACPVADLGLEDYWSSRGVCLIEWGELLSEILPECYTKIEIARLDDEQRVLTVSGEHEALIAELWKDFEYK